MKEPEPIDKEDRGPGVCTAPRLALTSLEFDTLSLLPNQVHVPHSLPPLGVNQPVVLAERQRQKRREKRKKRKLELQLLQQR